MNREYEKITEAEMIVWTNGILLAYGICVCLDFLLVGVVVSPIIKSAVTGGMEEWFKRKGGGGGVSTGKQIGKLLGKYFSNGIPLVPAPLVWFWIGAVAHNHPQLTAVTGKVGGKAVGAALGGPAGAKIGAAAQSGVA